MKKDTEGSRSSAERAVLTGREGLLKDLHTLPGRKILNRILEQKNPRKWVQSLSSGDFFWLVKKMGEEDCIPLLELASVDQWQYVLDLEIWRKDRLDMEQSSAWMQRLQEADLKRLVRWLLSEGDALATYHFFKSIEVIVVDKDDEAYDLPEGYFSLDGVYHIRVIDSEHRETLENIIREMAREDFGRYQSFLSSLVGVLPSELEEETYRVRNVRLAEHGFLPLEEAIPVYAPLDPNALSPEKPEGLLDIFQHEEIRAMVPVTPLYHTRTQNMLTETVSQIRDPIFLDKIRLEFAGLCNQIMSADRLLIPELDILIRTCQKAARTLNLALERLCGKDMSKAEQVLRTHSFVNLFRVGFGLALKLKWEAERWLKVSWFIGRGLDPHFWGEEWGGTLVGILAEKPQLYLGVQEETEYKDFEWLSELGECLKDLRRMMVLDGLFARLAESFPMDEGLMESKEFTFRSLLFNLWSRHLLELEPSFSALPMEQAKTFFRQLRTGSEEPPYEMPGFEEIFIKDFMDYALDADPEAGSILRDTLSFIWQEFREEYQWILLDHLDARYSKFIMILPSR